MKKPPSPPKSILGLKEALRRYNSVLTESPFLDSVRAANDSIAGRATERTTFAIPEIPEVTPLSETIESAVRTAVSDATRPIVEMVERYIEAEAQERASRTGWKGFWRDIARSSTRSIIVAVVLFLFGLMAGWILNHLNWPI